jgi:hypothetical protein
LHKATLPALFDPGDALNPFLLRFHAAHARESNSQGSIRIKSYSLSSFHPERAETKPAQGSVGIFNGNKPLKVLTQ